MKGYTKVISNWADIKYISDFKCDVMRYGGILSYKDFSKNSLEHLLTIMRWGKEDNILKLTYFREFDKKKEKDKKK